MSLSFGVNMWVNVINVVAWVAGLVLGVAELA